MSPTPMDNGDDPNVAVIGRGESVLNPEGLHMERNQTKLTDEEGGSGTAVDQAELDETEIQALQKSAGWGIPQVKLECWDPENEKQWNAVGKKIATRNLVASIPNLTCAFGVWLVWSGKFCFLSLLTVGPST